MDNSQSKDKKEVKVKKERKKKVLQPIKKVVIIYDLNNIELDTD